MILKRFIASTPCPRPRCRGPVRRERPVHHDAAVAYQRAGGQRRACRPHGAPGGGCGLAGRRALRQARYRSSSWLVWAAISSRNCGSTSRAVSSTWSTRSWPTRSTRSSVRSSRMWRASRRWCSSPPCWRTTGCSSCCMPATSPAFRRRSSGILAAFLGVTVVVSLALERFLRRRFDALREANEKVFEYFRYLSEGKKELALNAARARACRRRTHPSGHRPFPPLDDPGAHGTGFQRGVVRRR